MSVGWRTPLVGAAVLVVVSTTGAAAASPTPLPTPSTSAATLEAQAERQADALAREQLAQEQAADAATRALEASQLAQREAEAAEREYQRQASILRTAKAETLASRDALSRYLGSVYRTGVGDRNLSVLSDLIDSEDPQALFTGLSMASRVGENRSDQLAHLRDAEQAQAQAAQRAEAAQKTAVKTAKSAVEAKLVADRAVAEAKRRVAAAAVVLSKTRAAADVAAAREAALAKAEVIARTRSSAPPLEALVGAAVPRPDATCVGGSTAGFANGHIPADVLCPLWGTSGQILRADAAASFDAMSKKYAETFSAPICVTDSYRSFDEQVAVRAAKPTLAAVPGTSNHGWGVAVDLCDGVQTFGTPQHKWLQENAMAFGWFHPGWAQAGGSKPEAWHWEYAG